MDLKGGEGRKAVAVQGDCRLGCLGGWAFVAWKLWDVWKEGSADGCFVIPAVLPLLAEAEKPDLLHLGTRLPS